MNRADAGETQQRIPAAPGVRLRLQINSAGAWRTVVDYPADDDLACAQVLTAGPVLAMLGGRNVTLRICSADALQTVHSHWDRKSGWRPARSAAQEGRP